MSTKKPEKKSTAASIGDRTTINALQLRVQSVETALAESERQLAHAERSKVRAAYNRAQYMAERREMMQAWADYLGSLRDGGNLVAFRGKRIRDRSA